MIKKITIHFIPIFFLTSFMFPAELNAITAEDRGYEVDVKQAPEAPVEPSDHQKACCDNVDGLHD